MAHQSPSSVPVRKKPAGSKNKNRARTSHGRAAPLPRPHRKAGPPPPRSAAPGRQPLAPGPAGFTFHVNPTLTLVLRPDDAPVMFSLETAARVTGVHPEMLRYYCRAGLIACLPGLADDEPTFGEGALEEVRRIEHYRRHLAVSRRALPLVCELRRNAERQHIEIQFLRYP